MVKIIRFTALTIIIITPLTTQTETKQFFSLHGIENQNNNFEFEFYTKFGFAVTSFQTCLHSSSLFFFIKFLTKQFRTNNASCVTAVHSITSLNQPLSYFIRFHPHSPPLLSGFTHSFTMRTPNKFTTRFFAALLTTVILFSIVLIKKWLILQVNKQSQLQYLYTENIDQEAEISMLRNRMETLKMIASEPRVSSEEYERFENSAGYVNFREPDERSEKVGQNCLPYRALNLPELWILVPGGNSARFVSSAIESIFRQTITGKILFVDQGSYGYKEI